MKKDIDILNKIYRIVDIGIIGIEEVVKKVNDVCLEKIMLDQKKEYLVIKNDVKNLMDTYSEDPKELGTMMRVSNDIYTNMKLIKGENDQIIAKMMLEGTTKSIIEVTAIKHQHNYKNEDITPIVNNLLKFLENNERELKKYL